LRETTTPLGRNMVVQRRCAKYWALKSPSICMSLDLGKGSKEIRKRKPRAESDGVFKAGGRGWRDCRHHSMVSQCVARRLVPERGQKRAAIAWGESRKTKGAGAG